MKFKKVETLRPHTQGRCFTCFLYVAHGHSHGDSVYVGCEDGKVAVYHLQENSSHITSVREEELSKESKVDVHHRAMVSCLLHSSNHLLTGLDEHKENCGMVFSGSRDGTVKVWNSSGDSIQTLPHGSSVTDMADGHDGTLLSVCNDGYLRMWAPQAGRSMMLNPFYECTYSISVVNPGDTWLSTLAVDTLGRWSVFVGEGSGSISVYRKPAKNLNESDEAIAASQSTLKRFAHWEDVHELGVTMLCVMPEDGFVVSLSADASCKVVDKVLGHVIYSMHNQKRCVFTGMLLVNNRSHMLLTDELGSIHTFSFAKERLIASEVLCMPNRTRKDRILATHMCPMLGGFSREHFRGTENFFVFIKPPPKRGLSSEAPKSSSHAHEVFKEGGEIALLTPNSGEGAIVEFSGHQGPVVGLGVYMLNNSFNSVHTLATLAKSQAKGAGAAKKSTAAAGSEVVFQVSKEESAFFSCASDKTIRCWDEFDGKETYQFKTKSKADIICLCMLWGMNSLATGHENGLITLFNADAGTFVTSHVLHSSLTAVVEARSIRSHILVGADFSGKLAVWNLTLFKMNPVNLPLEMRENSHHLEEEPGILCLAVHTASNTFFSGGMDTHVIAWRLEQMNFQHLEHTHKEAVCALECSANFLLSGDERGEVVLWAIEPCAEPTAENMNPLPEVNILAKWFSFNIDIAFRSIISLQEIDIGRVFLIQADDGPSRTSVLWKVWLRPEEDVVPVVEDKIEEGVETAVVEVNAKDKLAGSRAPAKAPSVPASAAPADPKAEKAAAKAAELAKKLAEEEAAIALFASANAKLQPIQTSLYCLYPQACPGRTVSAHEAHLIVHEGDLNCARILGPAAATEKGSDTALRALYFGMQTGPVIKIPINMEVSFGEE